MTQIGKNTPKGEQMMAFIERIETSIFTPYLISSIWFSFTNSEFHYLLSDRGR